MTHASTFKAALVVCVALAGLASSAQRAEAQRSQFDTRLGVHPSPIAAEPSVSVQVSPPAVRQGDVLIVRVTAKGAGPVLGQFGDLPLHFAPDVSDVDGSGSFIGLLGMDAMLTPGPYAMVVTATAESGATEVVTESVTVRPSRYVRESVIITSALKSLLDPVLNAQEETEIRRIYSGFSPLQWWDGPFRTPVKGKLVSVYGNRRIYNGVNLGTYHSGYDYSANGKTPVKAAAPGRVAVVQPFAIRGLTVVIDHGRGVFTSYYHLSKATVSEGQMVDVGDEIGQVGTTGRSQGNHLHFELAVGGSPVDPGYWLETALP